MKIQQIPRVKLAHLPTPLDNAPCLASEIGLKKLLIKRDDLTGLALGGNKARKLEFLMADAQSRGADIVITDGGPQSNHARMTAAAARILGMEPIIVLGGDDFEHFDGNMLLDVVLGADIRYMIGANVPEMEREMALIADELRERGRNPYVIPIGGSTPLGCLGYVEAMREMSGQLEGDDRAAQIYVAVGSGGTFAGCVLGAKLFLPEAEVIGISVSRKAKPLAEEALRVASGAVELLGADVSVSPEDFVIYDEFYGIRYGIPTQAGNDAIFLSAETEGLILDPVYTGKAMSGLVGLARTGRMDLERTVVFIHTGGAPGLMAFESDFRHYARCTKIKVR